MRDQKVVLLTYSLIILMTVVGCESQVVSPPSPSPTVWESTYLSVNLECSSGDYCHYVIRIGPFNEDKEVDVTLRADYGIKFRDDLPPDEGLILSDAGKTATIKGIGLQPNATRIVYIPFSIWSGEELTGEYIVDVTLTSADQGEIIINQLQIKAFIQNGSDNSVHDRLKLISTQAEFDALYPFVDDETFASFIQLDQDSQYPREGNLYVRLVASHAVCEPMITLHGDGVEIEQRSISIMANAEEIRIVEFQFRIVEGRQARDGLHVFSISIEGNNHISAHQTLPVAVSIVSEPGTHQQHWLEKTEVDVVSTVGLTAADHFRGMGGKGPDLTFVSDYSETVRIGRWSMGNRAEQFTAEIVPEFTVTPTPTVTRIPPEPTPTLPPPTSSPSAVVASELGGASVAPNVDDSRCSEWNRTISATSNLTLLDVYQQHIEESIPEMRVNYFVLVFRLCNRISAEVGEVVLGAGEVYYLPNSNRP